jgi:ribose transport system ATP-binding protein
MEQIDKRFPGVHALDQVSFDLREGEVHVLLGENGAGKSTLVKILSGSVVRDGGRVFVHGEEMRHVTPERAQALGIAMVYQEFSLVPSLSVAENIFLGDLPRNRFGLVDWAETVTRAEESLSRLGVNIDPRVEVRQLDVAERQLTEIARVLTKNPRILLLDEPTSALSDKERERLFEIVRRLRERGIGIVHITHQLSEVPVIGDRVTVLRDGKAVGTLPVEEADEDTLVRMMVGRELAEHYPKEAASLGAPLLRVEGLSSDDVLHDLSFELRKGEILGLFGLMGAGQAELARVLFGLEERAAGAIYVDGSEVQIRSPADAIRQGLGFMTRDRQEALVPMLSIPPNVTLACLCQSPLFSFMNLPEERETAAQYVRDLRIDTPSLNRQVMYLSGGNQQKVVVARWLCNDSRILIFDDATRGIDVGAKAEVFALMNRLVRSGVGIIMISSDMRELLGMADRVVVMRDGEFTAEFEHGEATQEDILRSAS